jgi:hypothetical protein
VKNIIIKIAACSGGEALLSAKIIFLHSFPPLSAAKPPFFSRNIVIKT